MHILPGVHLPHGRLPLGVTVEHSAHKFTFTVETNGSLQAKDVVLLAIRELRDKLGRLQVATLPIMDALDSK